MSPRSVLTPGNFLSYGFTISLFFFWPSLIGFCPMHMHNIQLPSKKESYADLWSLLSMYLHFLGQSFLKMPGISASLKIFLHLLDSASLHALFGIHPSVPYPHRDPEKPLHREPEQLQGSVHLSSFRNQSPLFSVIQCMKTITTYIFPDFFCFIVNQ